MSLVPIEYVGQARALRARLAVADRQTSAAVTSIVRPLQARFARNPNPRCELLAGAARDWRVTVPSLGRLRQTIGLERLRLDVVEQRASTSQFRFGWWDAGATEPGLTILGIRLLAERGRLLCVNDTLAVVGLHALARRFQRGRDRTEAAILGDLAALAMTPTTRAVYVAVPGGRWVGEVVRVRDQEGVDVLVLAVRSYLNADMG